jgi:hypothetical protein
VKRPLAVPIRRRLAAGPAAFALAAALTLTAEFLIELRRGPVFAGAVRHYDSLEGPVEAAGFLLSLVVAQLALLYFLYRLVRWLDRRQGEKRAAFDFLFLALAASAVVLAVKAKLLRYFSNAIDLDIVRALGGGSLAEALLYVRYEALLLAAGLIPLVLAWLLLRRWLDLSAAPAPRRRTPAYVWAAAILLPPLLLWAGRMPDVRIPLERFTAPRLLYAGLGLVTDLDRDGYSLFSAPPDAQPFDAARHPFALDIPGNGVDEDGFGGDFVYAPPPPDAAPAFPGERRHVVLIVLESMRADAIGKTWGGRRVAPNLTALAGAGTAPEAYSNFGLTAAALKTIFSGRVAPAPGGPSLFRDFRAAGYRVGIFSGQAEDFGGIAAAAGMRETSDIYVDAETLSAAPPASFGTHSALLADGRDLLREMDRHLVAWDRPTFLYFNLQPPHFPYSQPGTPDFLPGRPIPRGEIRAANRHWVARNYWNSVAYADWLVGEVVRRLKAAGVYERSVIVAVGDHGEELFENGYIGHGQVLNDLQTRVPLIFSTPGIPVPRPAGLDDVRRLVLAAAGAAIAPPPDGPVFQFVGRFERPSTIGFVERGGRRTTLALHDGAVWTSDAGSAGRYADLPAGSALRRKVDGLVDLWAFHRWERHLASR